MDDPRATRLRFVPALAVGCLALVIGSITLGRKALWFDEAFDAVHTGESWGSLIRLIKHTEMSQSAYLMALKVWTGVTPDSEVWLRAPSVVLFAFAAALLVLLGTRLFDRLTGALAGILLATNALVVQHAQEARTYALVTFAIVLVSLLFVRALADPSRRNWLLYGAVAGLAVYCHFWAGLVIVAHLASVPFAPARPPLRRVLEGGALFALVITPALYFTATAGRTQLAWIAEPTPRYVIDTLKQLVGKNGVLAVAVAAGLALLAYRAVKGGENDRWRFAFVAGWFAIPIVLSIVISQVQNILLAWYAIVTTPALALAASTPIAAALRGRRPLAVAAAIAMVAVLAMSGYRVNAWYDEETEDWRAAAAHVAREARPGDRLVVVPEWAGTAYEYYDPEREIDRDIGDRRTFVLVYGFDRALPPRLGRVTEQASDRLSGERTFGNGLALRVFDPGR